MRAEALAEAFESNHAATARRAFRIPLAAMVLVTLALALFTDAGKLTYNNAVAVTPGETLDIVPRLLITGRRVAGSSFGGVKGREGVPRLIDLWMQGEIDVDPFISHRIRLDEVNRGFDLMHAQDGIRSVIRF